MLIPVQVNRKPESGNIFDASILYRKINEMENEIGFLKLRIKKMEENTLYNRFKWWLMYG